ncbi:hypothetical protein BBW65_05480 [Helicobacter enhydrae]|uniref:Uncharacterized protein n=1 Tax=Helicobacter enhydrae TaxID=222136 RepID=A0A1B1U6F9_9HELI|nr:hypothetical protein [Helicobacter enhydrae]ANV98282.1 hypothetical protein BBW65_05480 [Helicobacter enhydrae]
MQSLESQFWFFRIHKDTFAYSNTPPRAKASYLIISSQSAIHAEFELKTNDFKYLKQELLLTAYQQGILKPDQTYLLNHFTTPQQTFQCFFIPTHFLPKHYQYATLDLFFPLTLLSDGACLIGYDTHYAFCFYQNNALSYHKAIHSSEDLWIATQYVQTILDYQLKEVFYLSPHNSQPPESPLSVSIKPYSLLFSQESYAHFPPNKEVHFTYTALPNAKTDTHTTPIRQTKYTKLLLYIASLACIIYPSSLWLYHLHLSNTLQSLQQDRTEAIQNTSIAQKNLQEISAQMAQLENLKKDNLSLLYAIWSHQNDRLWQQWLLECINLIHQKQLSIQELTISPHKEVFLKLFAPSKEHLMDFQHSLKNTQITLLQTHKEKDETLFYIKLFKH